MARLAVTNPITSSPAIVTTRAPRVTARAPAVCAALRVRERGVIPRPSDSELVGDDAEDLASLAEEVDLAVLVLAEAREPLQRERGPGCGFGGLAARELEAPDEARAVIAVEVG